MCSLFGLIDFQECLSTHTKNKILNTLARECQVRGTDATGIAYNFNDRLRVYKRPLPARKMKIWQADCRDIGNKLPPMTTEKCAVPIKKKTSPFCSKQTEFTGCLIPALKRNMPEHGL